MSSPHNGESQLQARSENNPAGIKIHKEETGSAGNMSHTYPASGQCPALKSGSSIKKLSDWVGPPEFCVGEPRPTEASPKATPQFYHLPSLEQRLFLATHSPLFAHHSQIDSLTSLGVFCFCCATTSKCPFKYLLMAVVLIPLLMQRTTKARR